MLRNQIFAAIAIVIVIALGAMAIYGVYKKQSTIPDVLPSPPASSINGFGSTPSPKSSPPFTTQPQTGITDTPLKDLGIFVSNPDFNTKVSSPLTVKGIANVYEGRVLIRVKDGSGNILAAESATACMGTSGCPFEAIIQFEKPQTPSGTIELFTPSPVDGSEEDLEIIPVTF